MITEVLAQIEAPNFTAGIVLFDDVVVETAPVVRYMRRSSTCTASRISRRCIPASTMRRCSSTPSTCWGRMTTICVGSDCSIARLGWHERRVDPLDINAAILDGLDVGCELDELARGGPRDRRRGGRRCISSSSTRATADCGRPGRSIVESLQKTLSPNGYLENPDLSEPNSSLSRNACGLKAFVSVHGRET
ncbi:hypothetical protein ACVWXN_000423 [Bradyrhizobium sp. i1.4.4]